MVWSKLILKHFMESMLQLKEIAEDLSAEAQFKEDDTLMALRIKRDRRHQETQQKELKKKD